MTLDRTPPPGVEATEEVDQLRRELAAAREAQAAAETARAAAEARIEEQMRNFQQQLERLQQAQVQQHQQPGVTLQSQDSMASTSNTADNGRILEQPIGGEIAPPVQPSSTGAVENRSNVPFKEEAETLEKFSGEDETCPIRKWVDRVNELALAWGWNQHATCIAAKRALVGAAKDWLEAQEGIYSWAALSVEIINAFETVADEGKVLAALQTARPKQGETLVGFVHRMWRLGKLGNFGDRLIVECIVDGIPGDAFQKVTLYSCRRLDELKRALGTYEAVRRAASKAYRIDNTDKGGGTKCFAGDSSSHPTGSYPEGKALESVNVIFESVQTEDNEDSNDFNDEEWECRVSVKNE